MFSQLLVKIYEKYYTGSYWGGRHAAWVYKYDSHGAFFGLESFSASLKLSFTISGPSPNVYASETVHISSLTEKGKGGELNPDSF